MGDNIHKLMVYICAMKISYKLYIKQTKYSENVKKINTIIQRVDAVYIYTYIHFLQMV